MPNLVKKFNAAITKADNKLDSLSKPQMAAVYASAVVVGAAIGLGISRLISR